MCAPSVIAKALAGLSRREWLRLAAGAATGAVLASTGRAKSERTIGASHVVDLTHTLSPKFPIYPAPGITFPMKMAAVAVVEKNGFFTNKWELGEHTGTHLDAPAHFIAKGKTADTLPIENFIVPAAVIDLRERAKKDADAMLTVDDLKAWEKQHGELPEGAAVLLYSGWDAKTGDSKEFLGLDTTQTLHFPGFSPEACEFLVKERRISGAGVDTLSLDVGPSKEFKAHKAILGAGKWGLECLANLGKIPPAGATIFVGASKVEGASGGPARVLAMWN
jgi:kynurenine formamidase